MPRHVVAIDP